jgi:hypothetical protein
MLSTVKLFQINCGIGLYTVQDMATSLLGKNINIIQSTLFRSFCFGKGLFYLYLISLRREDRYYFKFLPARDCKSPRVYILLCCFYPRELAKLCGYTSCFVVSVVVVVVACLLVLYSMNQFENLPLQQGSHELMQFGSLPLQQGNSRRVHAPRYPATAVWYPANAVWHPATAVWYPATAVWYPVTAVWYPATAAGQQPPRACSLVFCYCK